MSVRFLMSHRSGPCDHSGELTRHESQLAALPLATLLAVREALNNLRHPSTPEGLACRRELLQLLDANGSRPADKRSMTTVQRADELLDRTRFDVRCNPRAIDALSATAHALAKRYALYQTHIPNEVGKKLHLLRDELHRLAQTSAGSGVKASRLRRLDQELEAQRLVIESCSRRVQGWREITSGSLSGLRRTT